MDPAAAANPPPLAYAAAPAAWVPRVALLYAVEAFGSVGGNLMQVGIFFYTNRRFGWGLRENFTLAAVQGVVYIAGALLAQGLTARLGPRRALAACYGGAGLAATAALASGAAAPGVVGAVLAYTAMMAVTWPILESLVSGGDVGGADPHSMARRISVYNVIWAGVGALVLAANGAIIDFWAPGVFVLTALAHGISAVLLLRTGARGVTPGAAAPVGVAPHPHAHVNPEPELLRVRTLALWLSRISMPASYALIYALSAMLPSLPPMQRIPTWVATVVGSAWLASRFLAFLVLGFSPWWHTRPRALLVAAWAMLAAFAALAWQPSFLFPARDAVALDLGWLVLCQVAIGFALGLIYSASLYFGMVLSDGSTEHGGYHEALIGLGSVLGPGAGAAAQWLRPGKLMLGVVAVTGVLALSTLLATAASFGLGARIGTADSPTFSRGRATRRRSGGRESGAIGGA
jgi:hypothetical protein